MNHFFVPWPPDGITEVGKPHGATKSLSLTGTMGRRWLGAAIGEI